MLQIKEWIPIVRDIVQALFFILVGIITVLTYLKAKRTLLQPIKTEVFKEQIKTFSDILRLFTGKTEIELREDFHFEELFYVNTMALYDSYASLFFDVDIDGDKRPYNTKDCPISHVPAQYLELANDYLITEKPEKDKRKPDPRTRAAIWNQHSSRPISIPKEFVAKQDDLQRIIDSPLLPKALVNLLAEYLKTIDKNVALVGEVLTEGAKEMPDKYPDLETLKKASFGWIRDMYVRRFHHMEGGAKEISNYLREYYSVDSILEQ